jgi:ribosomal-protein-alanine N-acetyltransferase
MTIPTVTTDRLVLRAFTDEDMEPLHALLGVGDVMRYFPNTSPPSAEAVQRLVSGQLKHWETYGYGWWAVELPGQARLIGWNGLGFLPETGEVEVAYLLGKAFWGKGYATEGARASVRFGFQTIGLESIIAIVHPENSASQRVVEKLGMSFLDRNRYFGMDCYRRGRVRPTSIARPLSAHSVRSARRMRRSHAPAGDVVRSCAG